MIQAAMGANGAGPVRYVGVDLFEARPADRPGLSIKAAYVLLGGLGARVQLAPGDPCSALARIANTVQHVQLAVVAGDQDPESLARAWFYLPRMLAPDAVVLVERVERRDEQRTVSTYRPLPRAEVERLAAAAAPGRRAA